MLAAVTSRSLPAQPCPRGRAGQTFRPPGSRSRSFRRRSGSRGGGSGQRAMEKRDRDRLRSDGSSWRAGLCSGWTHIVLEERTVSWAVAARIGGELTVGKKPRVKTLRRLVLPQAPSPMMTSFLWAPWCENHPRLNYDSPRQRSGERGCADNTQRGVLTCGSRFGNCRTPWLRVGRPGQLVELEEKDGMEDGQRWRWSSPHPAHAARRSVAGLVVET